MPNYADPNIDFGLEQELLIKALKESEAQRASRLRSAPVTSAGRFQITPESSAGGQIAAGLDRIVGNITKPQVEQSMRDLRGEETRRYDELSRQMNEPGTVDYDDPESLAADNTRRMGVASELSKLPMAKQMAQTYLTKGAGFPETLALLKTKQIEAGQQNAARLQESARIAQERQESREQQAEANRINARLIASGAQGLQQQRVDMAREAADTKKGEVQDKKQKAYEASISALAPIEASLSGLLTAPDSKGKRTITPELEAYTGNWDQYMPEAALKQSTVDAGAKLGALKDQITMINLAQAKQAVGQSFGSMQVKEWDKFVNTLSSLNRNQGKEQLSQSLNYINDYITKHKAELETAMKAGSGGGGGSDVKRPAGVDPTATVKERKMLSDGSVGIIWSDGSRTKER